MVDRSTLWRRKLKAENPALYEAKYAAPSREKHRQAIMDNPELRARSEAYWARRAKSAAQREEERRVRQKAWREANRDKCCEYGRVFRQENPKYEKVKAKLIIHSSSGLPISQIPDDLAEAKVAQLRALQEARRKLKGGLSDEEYRAKRRREYGREWRERMRADPERLEAHRAMQREYYARKKAATK